MKEYSLLLPFALNATIGGITHNFSTPHRLVVTAHTKSEARALLKKALAGWLPHGLTRRGDLIEGRGQEPAIVL